MRNYKYLLAMLLLFEFCLAGCEKGTKIKSLEPNFGNVSGHDVVVIHGNGFKTGMVVQFGEQQVKNVVIENSSRLRVKTPPGIEGKVDVIVIGNDGKKFALTNGFSYIRGTP